MPSVAEIWPADDLAGLEDNPLPRLQADLYRCTRETGWTPGQLERKDQPYVVHHAVNWQSPRSDDGVRMRLSIFAPVVGFVWASAGARSWGTTYVDVPSLTLWWQRAGWLVPDPSWLNAPFSASELDRLDRSTARELRRWHDLSRGDALFFDW